VFTAAFVEQNSLPISQNMSNPDPAESSSEDQLRKISSYMRQKLTASHRQWLATQSEALNTSSEQVMSDVLSEWVVRHRETVSNGGSLGDFLPEALEEFISRHREEFLPVLASG
jgi:archaellum biogenesis protein FlaJ (TadC family)